MPDRLIKGLPAATYQPTDHAGSTLGERARTGAMWSALAQLVLRFSNFFVVIVVARIISPHDLGVYAIAWVFYSLVISISGGGVQAAITRRDLDADLISPTVLALSITTGFLATALAASLADPISRLLGSPESATPIRILSLCLFLNGFFAVLVAVNQREFRQNIAFRGQMRAFVVSTAVLLILVHIIHGADAYAWSRVAATVTNGFTLYLARTRNLVPAWHRPYFLPLLALGVPLVIGTTLSQLVLNVDNAIVSRELSAADLGLYVLAFNIATWPSSLLAPITRDIGPASFSGTKHEGQDLAKLMSRTMGAAALVASPIGMFTTAFAAPLVLSVYGNQWPGAAPILTILALYGILSTFGSVFDSAIIASGKTHMTPFIQLATLAALVPAILIGIRLGGLPGVAAAHVAVITLVSFPIYSVVVGRLTGAKIGSMWRAVAVPLAVATLAAGVARVVTSQMHSPYLIIGTALVTGGVVYTGFLGPQFGLLLPARLARNRYVRSALFWPQTLQARLRR